MGARGGSELVREEIEVAGVRRSYWLARAPRRGGQAAPPLLIALHGAGMDGRAMAWLTGLAERGPAAGISVVFPDGWKGAWHAARSPAGQPELDDARFLTELTARLEASGAARSWPVFLAGICQGARYAEHVARNGLLPVTGLFLVAGTALESSRRQMPLPQLRASVILIMGTGDKTAPYAGGPLARHGMSGLILKRRALRHGELPGEDVVAGAEEVVTDWAAGNGSAGNGSAGNGFAGNGFAGNGFAGNGFAGNGFAGADRVADPAIEELPMTPGCPTVTRKTWTGPGCRPATLYRIDGGGHGWPGGPAFRPARVTGPVARDLDATGLLLEMTERETAIALGHLALDRGQIA